MNQLKHLMGIPITLPNGLALRGSTFSRSAGTNGRNPKRSGKLLVASGDDDEFAEPKLSSKSYAKIIEDYSKAIEARNAAAKLNADARANKNRGFFSKPPFQRLARVSSLVNIKNSGNNNGSNLCTESSSRPPIKTSHKSHRSKSGIDGREISDEVNKRAEWLDHVVKAHNVKKSTKNDNFANDYDHGKNKAHNLVQRLPESRATRNPTPSSFNDTCTALVKKSPATPVSDVNNMAKTSKTATKMLKSMSDTSVNVSLSTKTVSENSSTVVNKITSVQKNLPAKTVTDNSSTVVNKITTRSKAENTIPKIVSNTSVQKNLPAKTVTNNTSTVVDKISKRTKAENTVPKIVSNTSIQRNLPVQKLQDNLTSDTSKTPKKITSTSTITKTLSNTSVHKNVAVKKLQDKSTSEVKNKTKKSPSGITITKSLSNTSVYQNSSVKKLPDQTKTDVNNMSKRIKTKSTITNSPSITSVNKKMPEKKLTENSTHVVNNMSKKSEPTNTITKSISDTSINSNMSAKKIPDISARNVNNITSTKNKPGKTLTKTTSDTSIQKNISAKKIQENSARDVNIAKRRKTKNVLSKSTSDKSLYNSLSVKKLPDNSPKDAKIIANKSSTTEKTNLKSCSNSVDRYCSSLDRTSRASASNSKPASDLKTASNSKPASDLKTSSNSKPASDLKISPNLKAPNVVQNLKKSEKTPAHNSSADMNVVLSKSNGTRNSNQKSLNSSVDRSYSSVEKQSETSTSDVKNISVIVQRMPKGDRARESSKQNNQDANMMLVTVTENSKSSTGPKSCPLRHIDLRINGKPAADVDSVISKVDKLGVVSSAEKIEITIPILSKGEEADGDNLRARNSTINLCISSQAKESIASDKVEYTSRAEERIHSGGRSKSCLARPSRVMSSMKNARRPGSSTYRSKVIPWWTSADSFRRSEVVSARSTKVSSNNTNFVVKMSRVEQKSARVDHELKPKKVAFSEVHRTPNVVVAKPSSARQQIYRRKRASVISKVIANEAQKKIERDEQERLIRKQLTLERLKSYAKPEPKTDVKAKSTASNVPKPESVVVDSTMLKKTAQANTTTDDQVSGKNTALPKSIAAVPAEKSITVEIEPDKKVDTNKNNNLSNSNNYQGKTLKTSAKPISEIVKGRLSASKNRKAMSAKQNSESKPVSKIAAKLRQEVVGKSDTNATPQFPRTYGKIRLLPESQSLAKPTNHENTSQSSEAVKQPERTTSTDDKLSKVKNATITMKPIEKKKDGTLIDYGVTVSTRKKPERKLSGLESANGLQGKKIIKQKEPAVVATVKEVMPKRNRDTRSSTIHPRGIEDSAKSRIQSLDKNARPTSETRISPGKSEDTASKGTTNEQNESANLKTCVKTEKRDSKDSNAAPVIETASAADKKLVYSVWLRRFKERGGQDSDPTKDPSSRKP